MLFIHKITKITHDTKGLLQEFHLFSDADINLWSYIYRESIDLVLW